MNKPIYFLLCFTLFTHTSRGQAMDSITQKLIQHRLLEESEIHDFKEVINSQDYIEGSLVNALLQFKLNKLFGGPNSRFYSSISFDHNISAHAKTKINDELLDYLFKLHASNLVTEKLFNTQKEKINKGQYVDKIELLSSIAKIIAHEKYMSRDKLISFAKKLEAYSISSNANYQKLIKAIGEDFIQDPIQFLNYCDKALVINQKDYSNDPNDYLEKMHRKTAAVLPQLKFTDFAFQIVSDSINSGIGTVTYRCIVSLKCEGKTYKHKSFYQLYNKEKNEYFSEKISQQEYYQIFNKILSDLHSPYRLHEVKAYEGNAVNWETFGIIALTKEQQEMLHSDSYFSPSYENFKNSLTSVKIDSAINEYQKTGLLSHLNEEEIKIAREEIAQRKHNNLNDVLTAFPNTIHLFDMELANLHDPYAELVKDFARISHNDFMPTEISDNFDIDKSRKATLKFKFNNKNYEKSFIVNNDWIDLEYFEFIDSVVKENHLKGQFYQLLGDGQVGMIIYLTPEQYNYLRSKKLAVFGDEWSLEKG